MMPSCDHTGVPGFFSFTHFHSSTTSGSACWMSLRILLSVSPRQNAQAHPASRPGRGRGVEELAHSAERFPAPVAELGDWRGETLSRMRKLFHSSTTSGSACWMSLRILARGNAQQNAQAHPASRPGRGRGVEVGETEEPGHSRVVARRHHLHRRILPECREAYLCQGRVSEGP